MANDIKPLEMLTVIYFMNGNTATYNACGNIIRIDNALAKIPESLENWQAKLANLLQQQEAAKAETGKPFQYEEELQKKSARLAVLDAELNIGAPQPQTVA